MKAMVAVLVLFCLGMAFAGLLVWKGHWVAGTIFAIFLWTSVKVESK